MSGDQRQRRNTWSERSAALMRSANEVRCVGELLRYLSMSEQALIEDIPHGDGRPVLVIPGFLCGDASTRMLRRFLQRIGYTVYAWGQGINWGPKAGVRPRLLHRVHEIRDAYEQPVTLVGWSLGGYYAREIACIRPDLVREVITLGSPMHGNPAATAVWHAFRLLNRKNMPQLAWGEIDFPQPENVPCLSIFSKSDGISIFSKSDGIVPWQHCVPQRGRIGEAMRVSGSHIGLVANPTVMRMLGRHLGAQRSERKSGRRTRRTRATAPTRSSSVRHERRPRRPAIEILRYGAMIDAAQPTNLLPLAMRLSTDEAESRRGLP